MQKIMLALAFFFVASSIHTSAQVGNQTSGNYAKSKVYISIDMPVRGQATEDKKIFINSDKGSFAYVIIDNYPNKFLSNSIKLTSYKKIGGQYEKIKVESYDIDNTLTYTYIKYNFVTTGDFAFDVHDGNGVFINSGYVTVESKVNNTSGTGSNFSQSKAFVSTQVPVSGIAKESRTITIDRDKGSYAYIVLDNYPTNLNIKQLTLKVYRKVNGKFEKIDVKTYDISPDTYFTYIKYSFYIAGDYAFDMYDSSDQFINTANVTVNYN